MSAKQVGLFGWLGATDGADAANDFQAMGRAALAGSSIPLLGSADARAGLGVLGIDGSEFADANIRVACAGRARFSGPASPSNATASIAAQITAAYRESGLEVVKQLRGPFALAIVEPGSRTVLLAIDRMGMETLCYAPAGGGVVFGSRADAVAAHRRITAQIDPQSIFNYLFFHMVPAPGTIFRGVSKLLPAQYALWRDGRLQTGFYWEMPYEDRPSVSTSELTSRFRALLPEVVGRAGAGQASVATFLSGGTDSTTVTGTLAQLAAGRVDAYSIGFAADGFDEMEYARIAARRFDVRHHTYYVTPDDVSEAVPLVATAYDEPFGNASALPTYYCAKLARANGVELMLAGDGGDEIFGGNARYAKQKVFEAYGLIPPALRAAFVEPLALNVPGADKLPPLRKLRSYVQQARIPLPDRLESYNFLVRSDLTEIFEPDFLAAIDPAQPFALMRDAYGRARSHSAVNRMMHLDLKQTLADSDLRKVTAMCRLAGVDVAYPFLDDDMVALSAIVPPSGKVRGLRLRHFFKEALKDFLPPEIIAKTKHGFGLPFGVWLGEHAGLAELADGALLRFAERGYVRRSYIQALRDRHRSEHASYYGVMVWVILMMELWNEAFVTKVAVR